MKLLPFALFLAAAVASDNPLLNHVQSVYILPMGSGMDQYLANKITRQALFQVVTDPHRADAIFTDHIGASFERRLDELYPPPKPEKPKSDAKDAASKAAEKDASKEDEHESFAPPVSSFARGKGTFFLVDRKSRAVIWSTYDRAPNTSADTLDKKADQIVSRLKHDVKETPKGTK